jgi:hypothetical protein
VENDEATKGKRGKGRKRWEQRQAKGIEETREGSVSCTARGRLVRTPQKDRR